MEIAGREMEIDSRHVSEEKTVKTRRRGENNEESRGGK
jgi:hypothetical protein